MNHTQIQGPYDNYACKECTAELHAEMFEQNIELPDFDVPYVEYPCPLYELAVVTCQEGTPYANNN